MTGGPVRRVGEYELRALLGQGGMGEVWRAFHPRLGREVALKLLIERGGSTEERARRRERLAREARALVRVAHPNVLPLLDVGEDQGRPFLVLALVEGGGSFEQLLQEGVVPPRRAVDLAARAARGLGAAHAVGLVHRDLKPANILLDLRGEPLLADFGLVLEVEPDDVDRLTQAGALVGTPTYWAPEQARGEDATPATDVWALGASLYALLTGGPPWVGESVAEVLCQALEDRPALASTRRPGIPPAVDALLARVLDPDPALRPPHGDALADELEQLREQLTPVASARARARRAPRMANASVLVGVFVLGAAAAGAFVAHRTRAGPFPPPVASPAPPVPPVAPPAPPVAPPDRAEEARAIGQRVMEGLQRGGDPAAALAELERALALADDPLVRGSRGLARFATGDLAGALADLDLAIAALPDELFLRANRGAVRAAAGDHHGAIADFDAVLARTPDDAWVLCNRGGARCNGGDPRGALADLDRSIALVPDPDTHRNRAVARLKAGDPRGAMADDEVVLAARPDDVELLLHHAEAARTAGDLERAAADVRRALSLQPHHPRAAELRVWLAEQGR